jgi:CheY-like chemotaxis protein
MIDHVDDGSPFEAATLPGSEPASSPDLEEVVAWVECGQTGTRQIYRVVEALLRRVAGKRGDLFLILRHVERVDGSLTGFVLGIESILRQAGMPVILGDPSGVVPLVLPCPTDEHRLRLIPSSRLRRRVLIADPSPDSPAILRTVLGMFGHECTHVQSPVDARRAVPDSDHDLVLLDLEFPRMQSFAIAQMLAARRTPPTLVGMTEREDVWNPENSRRYGFRRILSKPYSAVEILEMASGIRLAPA